LYFLHGHLLLVFFVVVVNLTVASLKKSNFQVFLKHRITMHKINFFNRHYCCKLIFYRFIVKRVNNNNNNNNFLTNNNLTDVYKMNNNNNNQQSYYQQKYLNQSSTHKKTTRSYSISESFGANVNRKISSSVIPSKTFRYLERLMSVGN
jgi:hypothetical protein